MAHDSRRDDYLRMSLRYALSLDESDPGAATRAFAAFGRRLALERDTLPQTDADRAFHLVVRATELLDYRLPFVGDAQAETLSAQARSLLDEAVSLDPGCHDAVRMRMSCETSSYEERWRFLSERSEAVRASCEAERDQLCESLDEARRPLAASLAMRPWWRWMAEMAECALICGRNRESVLVAKRLLEADPSDLSDVRFTLAYALAKLEDGDALSELMADYPEPNALGRPDDAWIMLAQIALAHGRWDLRAARELVERLLDSYPGCAGVLVRQMEVSDGRFARIRVEEHSEDEMVLALSEGVVLLQEGVERSGKGVLGAWLARTVSELRPREVEEFMRATGGTGGPDAGAPMAPGAPGPEEARP